MGKKLARNVHEPLRVGHDEPERSGSRVGGQERPPRFLVAGCQVLTAKAQTAAGFLRPRGNG